jgi:hypothetical protein
VCESGWVSDTDSRCCVWVKVEGSVILTVGGVCDIGCASATDSRCCV